ncbi:hypothetical protein AMTR_s00053p00216970 [Amborella trichopoda]|uniref:WRKY domain-containing protein n=1 Tax=Amborella trichopoda TaxID=13333 RepID=W1PB75_AMBTC|nr:hypothetical protein AMTR_s00053p00216970 [Amborella trichopoda]
MGEEEQNGLVLHANHNLLYSHQNPPLISLNPSLTSPQLQTLNPFPEPNWNALLAGTLGLGSSQDDGKQIELSNNHHLSGGGYGGTVIEDNHGIKEKGRAKLRKMSRPRFAFQTRTPNDILDDGYRWRKYGQKAVKNSNYPRSISLTYAVINDLLLSLLHI